MNVLNLSKISLVRWGAKAALVSLLLFPAAGIANASSTTITGDITYAGSRTGIFHVMLSSYVQGSNYSVSYQVAEVTMTAVGKFLFSNLKDGTYTIGAYRDTNGNETNEAAEPWGVFPSQAGQQQPFNIAVVNGIASTQPAHGFDIVVEDPPASTISGAITYTGASTGTLWVKATRTNVFGGTNREIISFTSAAFSSANSPYSYSILTPNATDYRIEAFLDDSNKGYREADQAPAVVEASTFTLSGDVAGKNFTLVDAFPNDAGTGLIIGSVTYAGTQSGNLLLVLAVGDTESPGDFKVKVTSTNHLGVPFANQTFRIPNISTVSYSILAAGIDVNGDGKIGDGDPFSILGGQDTPTPITFPTGGGTTEYALITIADAPNGAIAGTVFISSGNPRGKIIVQAATSGSSGGCDDNCNRQQEITYIPGTQSYSFQLNNLSQYTSYHLTVYVDDNGNKNYDTPKTTSSNSQFRNFMGEPYGSKGIQQCSGTCILTEPVSVTTTSGAGFNITSGQNVELFVPQFQPPPTPTISTSAVTINSINWAWSTVLNGDGFRVITSTDGNISGDFLPTITAWTGDVGLATNTITGRAVIAYNYSGNSTSTFVNAYTLAAPATGTAVNEVFSSSITLLWANNTNPAGTTFTIMASSGTNPDTNLFSGNTSSTTENLFTTMSGLSAGASGTTYYFKIRADNGDGVATAYDTEVSTFIRPIPDLPVVTGFAAGVSSVTFNWTGVDYSDGFVVLSTQGVNLSGVLAPNVLTYSVPSLSTNSVITVRVHSFNTTGSTNSVFVSTYTAAVTPANGAIVSNSSSTIGGSWTANTNPAGTRYQAVASTGAFPGGDNFFSGNIASVTLNTSVTFSGLDANTTYYMVMAAINGDSLISDYTNLGTTTTVAGPVVGVTTSGASVDSLDWTWTAVPFAQKYNVYQSSSDVLIGNTTTTMFTQFGLSTNSINSVEIAAVNAGGEGFDSTPTTFYTLASVPTSATFSSVLGTSLVASWTANENPAQSTYTIILSSGVNPHTNSFPGNVSTTTFNLTHPFTGLLEGTTYYARVKAINGDGESTSFSAETSTITGPGQVVNLATSAPLGVSSITWTWNTVTGAVFYRIYRSSNSVQISSNPTTNSFTWTGLESNRPFGIKVSAVNTTAEGDLSSDATGYTLAAVPTTAPVLAASSSTMQPSWSAAGNPAQTTYVVTISSGVNPDTNSFPGNQSSTTFNTNATFEGLLSETTYYSRVKAINFENISTDFATTGSSITVPGTVVGLATAAPLGISSITWNWTAINGALYYKIYQASTTVYVASSTANTYTGTIFTPDRPFSIRVAAVNATGEGALSVSATGYTLSAPPSAAAFTSVAGTSLQANWGINGNPASTTTYVVTISTGAGASTNTFTGNQTSTTTGTSAVFSSLTEATTYFAQVKSINTENFSSDYTTLGSTVTGPPAVTGLSTSAPLGISSITWTWTAIPSTLYYKIYQASNTVQISSSASTSFTWTGLVPNFGFGIKVSAVNPTGEGDLSVAATGYTLAAAPGTAAFTSVAGTSLVSNWTLNGNPAGTTFVVAISTGAGASTNTFTGNQVSTVTVTNATFSSLTEATTYFVQVKAVNVENFSSEYTTLGSTVTGPPAVTGLSTSAPLGISSITWTWTAIPSTLFYKIYQASNTVQISSSASTSFTWSGLVPNFGFGIKVSAVNPTGEGDLSVAATGYTLAAVPSAAAPTNVSSTSLQANWGLNGNPAGTTFVVAISSGSGASTNTFTGNQTSTTLNTSASFASLTANTTYYTQVKAINVENFSTAYATLASTITTSGPPPGLSTTTPTGISSMSWTWGSIAGAIKYIVYQASDTTVLDGNLAVTTYTKTGLTVNSFHGIQVQAVTASGLSALSDAVTGYTLADAPTTLAFTGVFQSSASLTWNGATNPAATSYEIQWWIVGGATTTVSITNATTGTAPSLSAGTSVFLQVRALNGDGVPTLFSNIISTTINAAQQDIATGAAATVEFDGGSGVNTIIIPPSSFDVPVQITVQLPTASLPPAPTGGGAGALQGLTIPTAIEIVLDSAVQPKKPVAITMSYTAAGVAGLDPSKLIIARFDTIYQKWVPLVCTNDTTTRKVSCFTDHFSLFQIMLAAASDSPDKVLVFPNPFRPSLGHSKVTFAQLPENARIRIYTLVGELVKDLTSNNVGMATWDGTNQNGSDAASGVYYVYIQGAGQSTTKKVAIQR